jgi:hypothetical protein
VTKLIYLGTTITSQNYIHKINYSLNLENAWWSSLRLSLSRSRNVGLLTAQPFDPADSPRELHHTQSPGKQQISLRECLPPFSSELFFWSPIEGPKDWNIQNCNVTILYKYQISSLSVRENMGQGCLRTSCLEEYLYLQGRE